MQNTDIIWVVYRSELHKLLAVDPLHSRVVLIGIMIFYFDAADNLYFRSV